MGNIILTVISYSQSSGTGLTSWFKNITHIQRTRVIAKFKWHCANNLFEAVVYGQTINLFEFMSSYMRPIIQIQTESNAFILEYLQF